MTGMSQQHVRSASNLFLRMARLCGVGSVFIGISGLLGWIFDIAVLTSIIPGYKRMAISMSLIAILLGSPNFN